MRFGQPTHNIVPDKTAIADLDNWKVYAKIEEAGRKFLAEEELKWYQSEIAKRQYDEFPKVEQRAQTSFTYSRIAILVAISSIIVSILLKISCG